jgi:hypothetical protein
VGHGEFDVEVVGVEQFLLSRFDPSFASLRLTLPQQVEVSTI